MHLVGSLMQLDGCGWIGPAASPPAPLARAIVAAAPSHNLSTSLPQLAQRMPATSLLPSTLVRSAASAPRLLASRAFATSAARAKPLNLPEENPFTQGRRGLPDQSLAFAPLTPAEKNRPNELKVAQQGSNQLSLETPNNGAGTSSSSSARSVEPGWHGCPPPGCPGPPIERLHRLADPRLTSSTPCLAPQSTSLPASTRLSTGPGRVRCGR